MKHNEIEQAVMELCDAVPDFRSIVHRSEVSFCHGRVRLIVYGTKMPCIAQHAKHWAAQQGWMPMTDSDGTIYVLYLYSDKGDHWSLDNATETIEFDPTQLGSEELQWIRAVTDMAQLNSPERNSTP